MKKILLVASLALVPAMVYAAQAPKIAPLAKWAAPETDETAPAADLKFITDADGAARAKAYPMVPDSVPEIIRKGKPNHLTGPGVCMACHTTTGMGGPQSAPLAGLPAAYIVRTLNDMITGDRKTYRDDMTDFARILTLEEKQTIGNYYATVKFAPWIDVREVDMAPKVVIGGRDLAGLAPGGGEEPIGMRVVEVAKDPAAPYMAPGPAFIAYVPKGSIAKGATLVNDGGGKTVACAGCHNANLLGKGETPAIAGRSPTYISRELLEFKNGMRDGKSAAAMRGVAANLSEEDVVDIAAYLASRPSA